jgi:hypothetical protein
VTKTGRRAGLLLLHRAVRNAGDSLILERAHRLIADMYPDVPLDAAEAWHRLDGQIPADVLRSYRAVILCGGPGYARRIHKLYPIGPLDQLPPLVLLAPGSRIDPGTEGQLSSFRFDSKDRDFLDHVLSRTQYLGARDPLTVELLGQNGYGRVLMTGDPAWYDLDAIDRPVRAPRELGVVAFTPPANPAYYGQASRFVEALADAMPRARGHVVFHRGVQSRFAAVAERRSWRCDEISGSADGFGLYDEVDLHVGYRLHAHLYCISRGIPSYIIAEDSRATGAMQALPGLGVPAFDAHRPLPWLPAAMWLFPRVATASRPWMSRTLRPFEHLLGLPDVSAPLLAMIQEDRAAGFPAHSRAREVIRATLPTMRQMIATIP